MQSVRRASSALSPEDTKELPVVGIHSPPNSPRDTGTKNSPRRSRAVSLVRAISTRLLPTEDRTTGSQIVAPVSARLSLHARSSSAPIASNNIPCNKLQELMSHDFAALTDKRLKELTAQERTILKAALEKAIMAHRTPQEEESFAPRHSSPLRDTLDEDDRVKREALCRTLSHWIEEIGKLQN